jgi:hypothetical protein
MMVKIIDDWYWAAARSNEPAGDLFLIENGKDALWRRVRTEIDPTELCYWMPVQRSNNGAQIEDILDLMLTVVPTYGVNMNKFMFEAAKIPVFARFLRDARHDLCNYVSNTCFSDHKITPEPYSDKHMRKLGVIVSKTLGCDEDWFE